MNNMRHAIEISATKERIWEVLWSDKTFRDWANIIDKGTYLVGDLEAGKEVHFMSASSGYGVTSKVEKLIPNRLVAFKQVADVKIAADGSLERRDKQWEGGLETHELVEHDGLVTLSVTQDVPDELVAYFNEALPRVLQRIKVLAETT